MRSGAQPARPYSCRSPSIALTSARYAVLVFLYSATASVALALTPALPVQLTAPTTPPAPSTATSGELGPLFYTPEERGRLERQRADAKAGVGTPTAALPAVSQVTVDGYVRRTDGPQTTWVNGRPQVGRAGLSAVPVGSANLAPGSYAVAERQMGDRVIVRAPGEPAVALKPGQTHEFAAQATREAYQSGAPRPAAAAIPVTVTTETVTTSITTKSAKPKKKSPAPDTKKRIKKPPKTAPGAPSGARKTGTVKGDAPAQATPASSPSAASSITPADPRTGAPVIAPRP
jgi:hypothetical protein